MTNFPSSLDDSTTIPAESANTKLSTNHVTAHQNIQDAIEAIEAKVGANSSAVTTSHDYKLSTITGSNKAVSSNGGTLTSPIINLGSDAEGDTYYRNSSGAFTRLARGTDNHIMKMNGNVPNWEAETVTVNASTTGAGIVEEATQVEVYAGTAAGGTGARLFINPSSISPKWGGTGADGALTVTSGTTTIDLGSAAIVTKNYTSISITGTGAIAFSNPHASGTIVIFKSQGAVTITSSANPVIDLRSIGSTGGAAGTTGSSGTGSGGGGGASSSNPGVLGTAGAGGSNGGVGGTGTTGTGVFSLVTGGTGGGLSAGTAAGGTASFFPGLPSGIIIKGIPFSVGAGGGGGGGSNTNASGAGGRGAGSMYIECFGAFNFTTGTINMTGAAGTAGTAPFGAGGGGGGGGSLLVLCASITASSGTITSAGGAGGAAGGGGGGAGGNGGAGSSLVAVNTEFA